MTLVNVEWASIPQNLRDMNRVIKHRGPLRPNYPYNYTIMIGKLELIQLTNGKTGRKQVNKLISRPFSIFLNKLSAS